MNARPDRTAAELDFVVTRTIATSHGTCPFVILAYSDSEVAAIRARLKGRHRAGKITVKRGEDRP